MNIYRTTVLAFLIICICLGLQAQNFYEQFKQANDLVSAGKLDEAIAQYQSLLKAYPHESMVYLQLGLVYANNKNERKAVEYLSKAAELKPDNLSAHYYLGLVYLQQKNYAKAIASLKKAEALAPNDVHVLYNLGIAYAGQRKYKESAMAYSRCAELKPDYINAYISLADVYDKMGNKNGALKQVKELRKQGAYDLANALAARLEKK